MRSCSAALSRSRAVRCSSERPGLRSSASRFARREVRGVRSSCPASAAKRARRGGRGLQPREHRVQRAGQRADLVRALVGQRRAEVLGAAHARGARLQPGERAHRERAEQPRRQAGEREGDQAEQQDRAGACSPPAPRRLRGRRGPGAARRPGRRARWQRAPRVAVDLDRREPLAPGGGGRAGGDVAALGHDLVAVGDLHEAPRARQQPLPPRRAAEGPAARAAAQHLPACWRSSLSTAARPSRSTAASSSRPRSPRRRDRQQRGQREPRAQAARQPHGRSAQPTPRTVCSVRGSLRGLELAAHVADEHVHHVRLHVGRVAPHEPQQLVAGEDLPRVPGEHLQQVELAAGQLEVAPVAGRDVAAGVDDDVAHHERPGPGAPRRRSSACSRAVSSAIANGLTR